MDPRRRRAPDVAFFAFVLCVVKKRALWWDLRPGGSSSRGVCVWAGGSAGYVQGEMDGDGDGDGDGKEEEEGGGGMTRTGGRTYL